MEPWPCPAEHVKLTILGVEVWADPEKCEWRCWYGDGYPMSGSHPDDAMHNSKCHQVPRPITELA